MDHDEAEEELAHKQALAGLGQSLLDPTTTSNRSSSKTKTKDKGAEQKDDPTHSNSDDAHHGHSHGHSHSHSHSHGGHGHEHAHAGGPRKPKQRPAQQESRKRAPMSLANESASGAKTNPKGDWIVTMSSYSDSVANMTHSATRMSAASKYKTVATITSIYCVIEISAAIYTGSLSLLSDAFHNIGDLWALFIAHYCESAKQRKPTGRHSFGWARLEVLGALANAWSLIALCIYISLQAIPRFITPEPLEEGLLFVWIAAAGLAVNVIGTFLFSSHGHMHSHLPNSTHTVNSTHHGHSHTHGHSHGHGDASSDDEGEHDTAADAVEQKSFDNVDYSKLTPSTSGKQSSRRSGDGHSHADGASRSSDRDMDVNMRAVFLHFLGDCLSSFCVLCTGLLIHHGGEAGWVVYVDPISSLLIVAVIAVTTIPLVQQCNEVVLQSAPAFVDVAHLEEELSRAGNGRIIGIHELHIWSLSSAVVVASVHVVLERDTVASAETILEDIRKVFHTHGIHSITIQTDFVSMGAGALAAALDGPDDALAGLAPGGAKKRALCEHHCAAGCKKDFCCSALEVRQL